MDVVDSRPRAAEQAGLAAAEAREIAELEEQLAKMDGIKDRVVSMLDSFDDRLRRLETTVLPVYRSTQKLTRAADNLDRILLLLNNVNVYQELPRQEEHVINRGPSADKIDEYLTSIDRIRRAARYLSKSQIPSADSTLRQLNALLAKGLGNLEGLFKQVLASYSNPFDPSPYITNPIPTLPPHILSFLATLASSLLDAEHDPSSLLLAYISVRQPYLQKCMEQPIARCEDRVGKEGYTKGSAGVVTAGKAMLRLLKAEHVLSHSVFPTGSALPSQALSQTVASTAQLFLLSAVQSTVGRIRKSLARAEFNDSLALFDLLESCTEVLREPGNVADAVSDAGGAGSDVWEGLGAATVTGAMFLRRFATETKAESDRGVPADGTVSELTSNTLNILRRLKDYLQTLELILSLFPNPFKTSDPTLDPQTKTRIVAALADPNPQETVSSPRYFADILDALLTNIETKSRNYKKSSLQAVFLMNNYSYVLSALRTDLPNLAPGDYELRCEKGLAKWREVYLDGWKPVLEHLMDITYVSGGKVQGQLGRAQREVIKEKFKNFNTEFETMLASSRALSVPDPMLRTALSKELRSLVLPMYGRFYDKYQTIEFSKNPDKYIRWDKAGVEKALSSIWEVAG